MVETAMEAYGPVEAEVSGGTTQTAVDGADAGQVVGGCVEVR
jgi:hypothetical protein